VVRPVRLGVVSYLNSEPLVWGLEDDPGFEVRRDVPSRVAEMLHAGEVDLGLIPSAEYARGDYAIVPGVSLASRGPVRSVSLFLRRPLDEVRRVALDTSSRTSVALTRVLLRERLGRDPEYLALPPSLPAMLEAADAALLIGDPALYDESGIERLDLGEEWTRRTGLPFVYAFWAGPPGAVGEEGVRRLQAVREAGLAAIPAIASRYNGQRPDRAALNEAYLRRNMVYDLGPDELKGLAEFYRRLHALALVPRIPELRFHGHP
jgi:chorismate dehydratase